MYTTYTKHPTQVNIQLFYSGTGLINTQLHVFRGGRKGERESRELGEILSYIIWWFCSPFPLMSVCLKLVSFLMWSLFCENLSMLTGILVFEGLYFVFHMTPKQKPTTSLVLSQRPASPLLEKLAELDLLRSYKLVLNVVFLQGFWDNFDSEPDFLAL